MNEKQTNTEVGAGLDTPAGYATTDLTAVGEGRNTVVRLNLDRAGDSVSGQTVVDPKARCLIACRQYGSCIVHAFTARSAHDTAPRYRRAGLALHRLCACL